MRNGQRLDRVIENLLSERQTLRSNDKALILEVFAYYGLKLTPEQEMRFYDMPSTESIRRVRQKLQEDGKYLADPEIKRHRHFRSMRIQQIVHNATPKYVVQTLL